MFEQKNLSQGVRVGLAAVSAFLALILFVSILATTLVIDIRVAASEDTLKEVVLALLSSPSEKAPETSAQDNARIALSPARTYQSAHQEEPDDVAEGLTQQLINMLYEELGNQIGQEMPVSLENFTTLINESTAKDYIAVKTAGLIADYFNDEITTTFAPEEILTLIAENQALIEAIVGEPLPDEVAQQVATVFHENSIVQKVEAEGLAGFMELINSTEDAEDPGSVNMLSVIDSVVVTLRTASATTNLLLGIGLCLVLMAAIILTNCHQLGKGLRRVSYPFLIVGVLGLCLYLLVQCFPATGDLAMLLPVLQKLIGAFVPVYVVTLGIGVLFVAGGIVLPIVLQKKALVPVQVPSTEETPVEEEAAPVAE